MKDDKLFVSIRENPGIYVLSFGATGTTSPVWSHLDVFYGASYLPVRAIGVHIGTLVLSSDRAHDLADEEWAFAR